MSFKNLFDIRINSENKKKAFCKGNKEKEENSSLYCYSSFQ